MTMLPVWLCVVTAVVSGLAGVRYGRALQRRGVTLSKHMRVRDIPLIPVCLLGFVAFTILANLLFARPQWGWFVPLWIEYYIRPFFWAAELVLMVLAMAAVSALAIRSKYRYRFLVAALCIAFILAHQTAMRRVYRPNLPELSDNRRYGVILQSSPSTCGAATCANIAARFGMDYTEAAMAQILGTRESGTSPAQVVYGMRRIGLNARKVRSPDAWPGDITPPAVLLIDWGTIPDGHAVAYMSFDGNRVEIWDPLGGPAWMTVEQLRSRWRGRAIEVYR